MTTSTTTQTMLRVPSVPPEILRMERYVPLVLSVHASLTLLYSQNIPSFNFALWLILDAIFVISMWLLILRDTQRQFVLFRAIYLAVFVWLVTALLGGASTFFLFWGLAVSVIYTP